MGTRFDPKSSKSSHSVKQTLFGIGNSGLARQVLDFWYTGQQSNLPTAESGVKGVRCEVVM